jgi:hypothetical protein
MNTITEIAHLRARIIELLEELDKERNLIAAMREHIERAHAEIDRSNQNIKQWIEGFETTVTKKGGVEGRSHRVLQRFAEKVQ